MSYGIDPILDLIFSMLGGTDLWYAVWGLIATLALVSAVSKRLIHVVQPPNKP